VSKPRFVFIVATIVILSGIVRTQGEKPLQIYSIDVEGGQATLFVSPSGQSMLVDAGFPGPRDADRISAAAKDAGINQIDYFLNTHLHADHFGSIPDLVTKVSVQNFIDNGRLVETGERSVAAFQAYAAVRDKGSRHTVPKPGDKIPISGLDVRVVIAGGVPIATPLAGAGAPNALCRDWTPLEEDKSEDARSIGVVVRLRSFRMLDLGDLTWNKEHELACPNNLVGTVDVYLTTRHGLNGTGSPVAVHVFQPRVAVFNNAGTKGASREHWMTVKTSPGLEDMWQLHLSMPRKGMTPLHETTDQGGKDVNAPERFIANLDDTTAHYIKITVRQDGTFTVKNSRTGFSKEYARRRS
jgi:beta-lactamase superfamily II metal-dependent hydrolase